MRNRIVLSLCLAACMQLSVATASAKAKDSVRYSVPTPYSKVEAGAARVRVKAKPADVLGMVTDYARYSEFIAKFEKVRIISRTAKTVDVYLQVPILKGAAKVWAVLRFGEPQRQGTEFVVEGHLIKGNVERLDTKWRVVEIDPNNAELRLEMLLLPKFPAPGSIITSEVAGAADHAVCDLRNAAENPGTLRKK